MQLCMFKCDIGAAGRSPHKLALVQPARSQPHTHSIVHQDLDAVGALVGKDISVVGVGSAEDGDHPGQGGVGACAHVQWGGGQPGGMDADGGRSACSVWADSAGEVTGECTVTDTLGRRHSMRMSCARVGAATTGCSPTHEGGAALSAMGMKAGVVWGCTSGAVAQRLWR